MRLIELEADGHPRRCRDQPVDTVSVEYAILSHTWGDEELEYSDFDDDRGYPTRYGLDKSGYQKLENFARIAREHGVSRLWMDTCCIDKSNSAELQESLNSMFKWYRDARVCIIYLDDFEWLPEGTLFAPRDWGNRFRSCRWFRRGWTLQELVAPGPEARCFYDKHWQRLDGPGGLFKRKALHDMVAQKTQVPMGVLEGTQSLQDVNIAGRMRWAANRKTTQAEDVAYSLLGIFGVQITPQYGEGAEEAFLRLQKEILKQGTGDASIFVWTGLPGLRRGRPLGLLAPHPDCFDVLPVDLVVGRDHLEAQPPGPEPTWDVTSEGHDLSGTTTLVESENRELEDADELSARQSIHMARKQRSRGPCRAFRLRDLRAELELELDRIAENGCWPIAPRNEHA